MYKKGSGVIPSDVRLYGNDWKEFDIKVNNGIICCCPMLMLMHNVVFLCSLTITASI